jgi:O-antigen ligase
MKLPISKSLSLIGLPITVAIIANTIPYFNGTTYLDSYLIFQAAPRWQIVGLAAIFIALLLSLALHKFNLSFSTAISAGPFALFLLIDSMLSVTVTTSLFYAALFLAVAISIAGIRLPPADWLTIFSRVAFVMITMIMVFCAIKPFIPELRAYGAVHPNTIGDWAIVTTVLSSVWSARFRWCVAACMLALCIAVDSRFAFLFLMIFILVMHVIENRQSVKSMFYVVTIAVLIVCVLSGVIVQFVEGSGERSLSGGISGREERWEASLIRIEERPTFGYGFRSAHQEDELHAILTPHSGLLSLMQELGLIGTGLFVWMVIARVIGLLDILRKNYGPKATKLAIVFVSFMAAYISPFLFEPNYINFGDPLGILFLLVLFIQILMTDDAATRLSDI